MGLFKKLKSAIMGGDGDYDRGVGETGKGNEEPGGDNGGLRGENGGRGKQRGKENGARSVGEIVEWLGVDEAELRGLPLSYSQFSIPKRSGGVRRIDAPNAELKQVQRLILRRLLVRLRTHEAATGFERGHSIVTNARPHVGHATLVRLDIRQFFTSTGAKRVEKYFRLIGWNKDAARLLTRLCTHGGSLPQGAPTSPRLSNLVNYPMDARLQGLAGSIGAQYSRYADDMTFSMTAGDGQALPTLLGSVPMILADYGYEMHMKRKLHIRHQNQCQQVTGLVVNQKINLPRQTRRWLRSVEHRKANGGNATLTDEQLAGWRSLAAMVEQQRGG